jgi:CheY-like chemotaxis protein
LTNAVKFTPPSGTVRLAVAEEADEVVMRIRDTGIGISPEMLPRVFEMFAQADTSLDRSAGGLGIGLALAKSLVEMHDGRIEAHSEGLGKGAQFVARFPLLRKDHTMSEVPHLYFGKRVALVEDNDDARQSLSSLLESMGMTVLPARDAHEALRIAAEGNPDAFVVDIGLPGMNGYDFARVVRELPGIQKRLLIALTGYGNPEEKQRAAAAGFDHHLTKPADVDELYRLLTAPS